MPAEQSPADYQALVARLITEGPPSGDEGHGLPVWLDARGVSDLRRAHLAYHAKRSSRLMRRFPVAAACGSAQLFWRYAIQTGPLDSTGSLSQDYQDQDRDFLQWLFQHEPGVARGAMGDLMRVEALRNSLVGMSTCPATHEGQVVHLASNAGVTYVNYDVTELMVCERDEVPDRFLRLAWASTRVGVVVGPDSQRYLRLGSGALQGLFGTAEPQAGQAVVPGCPANLVTQGLGMGLLMVCQLPGVPT